MKKKDKFLNAFWCLERVLCVRLSFCTDLLEFRSVLAVILDFLIVCLCFFEFWKSIYASCDLIGGF